MRAKEQPKARVEKTTVTRRLRAVPSFVLGLFAVLAAPSAWAQSCVLCYTSVAGGGPVVIRAFEWGVLSLLTPALLLFGGVFFLIYRRARAADEQSAQPAARPVVRPTLRPVVRPIVAKAASRLPIRGSLPTTAS
jgi:hypothetical protein